VRYCSLECYKKHSGRCTESFYRENAVDELRGAKVDDEQRQSMLKILKRVADQDAGEDLEDGCGSDGGDSDGGETDPTELSEQTLRRLLELAQRGDDSLHITEADLTEAELQAFHEALASGAVGHLVKEWEPWWYTAGAREKRLTRSGTPLISAAENEASHAGNVTASDVSPSDGVPSGPGEPLPTMKSLLNGREASELLRWHLLDILFSYCHMMRKYNGDYGADPAGAVAEVIALSDVLGGTRTGPDSPSSTSNVLLEMMARATRLFGPGSRASAMLLVRDVTAVVLAGRGGVVCALWDAKTAVCMALEEAGEIQDKRASSQFRQRLQAVKHKMFFLAVWANEFPALEYEALGEMCRAVCGELDAQLHEERAHAATNQRGVSAKTTSMEQLLSGISSVSLSAQSTSSNLARKVEMIGS